MTSIVNESQFFNNTFCNIPKFIKFSFFPAIDSQISGQGFVSIFDNISYMFVIFFLFTSWSFTLISCDFVINESELCRRYFIKHDVLSQLSNFFLCALEKYFGSILMTESIVAVLLVKYPSVSGSSRHMKYLFPCVPFMYWAKRMQF